jgi:hypothetical protein
MTHPNIQIYLYLLAHLFLHPHGTPRVRPPHLGDHCSYVSDVRNSTSDVITTSKQSQTPCKKCNGGNKMAKPKTEGGCCLKCSEPNTVTMLQDRRMEMNAH